MDCIFKNKIAKRFHFMLWIAFLVACAPVTEESEVTQKIKKVEVFIVQPETFQETIVASAVASAYLDHRISTEVSGLLKVRRAERGDRVKKGDVLFEIDPENFMLKMKEKQAALTRAEANFQFMQAEAKRKKPLFQAKTLSQAGWDKLQFDLASAIAEKKQAQIALEQSRRELRLTKLKSPIDGLILEDYHDTGEVIPVGTVLAWITDTTWMTFDVGVSDLELRYLGLGDAVSVRIDAFEDRPFVGKITRISGNASPNQGTFPVEVEVENRDKAILPGVVGRLRLSAEKHEAQFIIPMMGVHQEGGESFVFLVKQQKVVKNVIKLGKVLGDRVLVKEGLKAEDQIVLIAQGRLEAGEPVEVIRSVSAGAEHSL